MVPLNLPSFTGTRLTPFFKYNLSRDVSVMMSRLRVVESRVVSLTALILTHLGMVTSFFTNLMPSPCPGHGCRLQNRPIESTPESLILIAFLALLLKRLMVLLDFSLAV